MSERQGIRDELAATIHENFNACRGRGGVSPDALAQVIMSSPVIRRIQAEAWAQGQQAGWCEGYSHGEPEDNPYRDKADG